MGKCVIQVRVRVSGETGCINKLLAATGESFILIRVRVSGETEGINKLLAAIGKCFVLVRGRVDGKIGCRPRLAIYVSSFVCLVCIWNCFCVTGYYWQILRIWFGFFYLPCIISCTCLIPNRLIKWTGWNYFGCSCIRLAVILILFSFWPWFSLCSCFPSVNNC